MKTELLSVTYQNGKVRYSDAVYFSGTELYSMTVFLGENYIEENIRFPKVDDCTSIMGTVLKNVRDNKTQIPCEIVEINGVIYGVKKFDNGYYEDTEYFIVENKHLKYVKNHSEEILIQLKNHFFHL